MNLVTAERTDQQDLSAIKIQVEKLADHVEDLDDHLRGVAGHDSLDTRVTVLEKHTTENSVLLREIKRKLETVQKDVGVLTLHKTFDESSEQKKSERFKEWLKFWGPIIIATLALIVPLANLAFQNWEKIQKAFQRDDFVSRYAESHRPRKKIYRVRVIPGKKSESVLESSGPETNEP